MVFPANAGSGCHTRWSRVWCSDLVVLCGAGVGLEGRRLKLWLACVYVRWDEKALSTLWMLLFAEDFAEAVLRVLLKAHFRAQDRQALVVRTT